MNTTEKITNVMNVRSKVQKENVFIPEPKLIESAVQLYEKIEQLKSSVKHQLNTLKNWNDKTPQSNKKYAKDCLNDALKLEKLEISYKKVLTEMIKEI